MKRLINSLALAGCLVAFAGIGPSALADGTIAGTVKFDGRMAKPKKIRVSGDVFCVKARAEDPLLRETYLFNTDKKTLLNVLVYVSDGVGAAPAAPSEPVEMTQEGCQYLPHVSAVMVGQKLKIKNDDDTAHNLNLKPEKNSPFNEGQPVKGMVKEVVFGTPELAMPLKCDVHSWMSAWVHVLDNPYFAINDENGDFKIENVPAGTYKLSVWHEFDKFSPVEETITVEVKDGETTTVEFTYQPPK